MVYSHKKIIFLSKNLLQNGRFFYAVLLGKRRIVDISLPADLLFKKNYNTAENKCLKFFKIFFPDVSTELIILTLRKSFYMQHKTIKLILVFVVLFSLQIHAQDIEPSKHPKMDKYYPPAPNLAIPKNPQTDAPAIKPATGPVVETKPTPIVPETKPAPVITSTVVPETISKPAATTNSAVTPPVISQPVVTAVTPDTTTKEPPVVTVEKPVVAPPQPKPLVSKQVGEPYNPNRLGSSTKEYDTWEKNNNGAGSVTTHSK